MHNPANKQTNLSDADENITSLAEVKIRRKINPRVRRNVLLRPSSSYFHLFSLGRSLEHLVFMCQLIGDRLDQKRTVRSSDDGDQCPALTIASKDITYSTT